MPNTNQSLPPVSAAVYPGAWVLPQNAVWSLPAKDMALDCAMIGSRCYQARGLVVDRQGGIYGVRNMGDVRSEGYNASGRVSIGGKKVAAWTSSQLFERPDGSLCRVEVIVVHAPPRTNVALALRE